MASCGVVIEVGTLVALVLARTLCSCSGARVVGLGTVDEAIGTGDDGFAFGGGGGIGGGGGYDGEEGGAGDAESAVVIGELGCA